MVDLGKYFLLVMCVFTVESKADFLNNPWEGMEGGNQVWRRGEENILFGGHPNPLARAAIQLRLNICTVLSWVCPWPHWGPSAPTGHQGTGEKGLSFYNPSSDGLSGHT